MNVLSFQKILYHPEHVLAIKNNDTIFPVHATVSLSNHCNHKCLWCTAYEFQLENAKVTDINKLLNFLKSAKKRGLKAVSYIGNGEPTAYPHFSKLVKAVYELGIEQGMFTNGFLLNKFSEEIFKYFTWIRVSLDAGSTKVHNKMHDVSDHFNKIIDNIKYLVDNRKNDLMIGVQYAVHHENIDDIYSAAKVSSKIGADYFSIKPVFSRGGVGNKISSNELTSENIEPYYKKILKDFGSDKFEVFYRSHQILSHEVGRTVLNYNKCVAGFFNINIYEDEKLIYCAPHKIAVGTLDDDIELIEKNILELSSQLNLNYCPAGCRYHELNALVHNVMNPYVVSKKEHTNFI